jgi:uncharacterized protein YceH (UPF0502 family)
VARVDTDLEPQEGRVLGCLLEKQRLTPDAYPLTLNGLRLACNQSTNREPVLEYDDATVRDALARLVRRGYVRLASGPGSRAPKYRHLLSEALELTPDDLAVLAVLLLRGPQTPGELRARSDRLQPFAGVEPFDATVAKLTEMGMVERIDRRPGQKEDRYSHRLSENARAAGHAAPGPPPATAPGPTAASAPARAAERPSFDAPGSEPGSPFAATAATGRPAGERERERESMSSSAESRWREPADVDPDGEAARSTDPAAADDQAQASRIDRLEGAVSMLHTEVARLRGELDRLREELGDTSEQD